MLVKDVEQFAAWLATEDYSRGSFPQLVSSLGTAFLSFYGVDKNPVSRSARSVAAKLAKHVRPSRHGTEQQQQLRDAIPVGLAMAIANDSRYDLGARTLLAVALVTGLRPANLVPGLGDDSRALRIEDLTIRNRVFYVGLRISKTSKRFAGDKPRPVPFFDAPGCPTTLLRALVEQRQRTALEHLFDPVDLETLAEALEQHGAALNLKLTPYSLRMAFATTLFNADTPLSEIEWAGAWQPGSQAMRGYIRPGTAFAAKMGARFAAAAAVVVAPHTTPALAAATPAPRTSVEPRLPLTAEPVPAPTAVCPPADDWPPAAWCAVRAAAFPRAERSAASGLTWLFGAVLARPGEPHVPIEITPVAPAAEPPHIAVWFTGDGVYDGCSLVTNDTKGFVWRNPSATVRRALRRTALDSRPPEQ